MSELPPGVRLVKHYATQGDLVECSHAGQFQRPTGGWAAFPEAGHAWRGTIVAPVLLDRSLSEREARAAMPERHVLDYGGSLLCIVCKGDEHTTACFTLPVRLFADALPELRLEQVAHEALALF